MAKYIERESAIKSLLSDCLGQVSYSREDAADCIFFMDTADVVPVRHGRWKPFGRNLGECSECGEVVAVRNNYCPNRGAKMDGCDGNIATS